MVQGEGWGMLPSNKVIQLAQFNTVTQSLQNNVGHVVLARPWHENPTDKDNAWAFALAQVRTYCDQHGLAFHEEQVKWWHLRPLGYELGHAISSSRWDRDERLDKPDDEVAGYFVSMSEWIAAQVALKKRKAKEAAAAVSAAAS